MSEVEMQFPFPNLPVDVARHILETAALTRRRDASRLVLVSKAVRAWIDPILYHTVVIDSSSTCTTFANTVRSRNDPSFFARHVKRLCLHYNGCRPEDLRCLLDVLTGLRYLAWWCDAKDLLPYINTSLTSIRYLSTVAELDSPHTVQMLLPRNLTHLNVQFDDLNPPFGDSLTAVWKAVFTRCPFLTHIMVDYYPSDSPPNWASDKEQFVGSALSVAPATLKAFIIEFQNVELPTRWDAAGFGPFLADSRFIIVSPEPRHSMLEGVVCYPIQHEPLLDWQHLDATSPDIWEFVDSYMLRTR